MGAPLAPVANVVKVIVSGSVGDRVWANVLHWAYTGSAPTPTDCAAIALDIFNAWQSHVTPLQNAAITMYRVDVTDLSSSVGAEGSASEDINGTRSGGQLPANAAVLISYGAILRYKGGHPRTYLLALSDTDLFDPKTWTSGAVTAVNTGWVAFRTAVTGVSSGSTTLTAQVCVRYHGKYLPNGGPPHYYLTTPMAMTLPAGDVLVDTQLASQRRRIGRVRS
jgi:hypothetical protein